jgi:hypothetical protein
MKNQITRITGIINERVRYLTGKYNSMSRVERNRILILFISLMILFNYILFCYHTDKNIFNIFPAIPHLDKRTEIKIFLPDQEAKEILSETRKILIPDKKEDYIEFLFNTVAKGSIYENTSNIVPVKMHIRKIWLYDDSCIIDIALSELKNNARIVPGSEESFKIAIEKTIKENLISIKRVMILLNGVPERKLW